MTNVCAYRRGLVTYQLDGYLSQPQTRISGPRFFVSVRLC